jgi:ABC-2 type transport system permease protein
VYFYGDAHVALALVGVTVCELFVGLGLSSVTSTLTPYPVPKPGDSPFAQPQSVGAAAAVVQGFSLVVIIVLSAPAIVFGVLGVFVDPAWFVSSLWAGARGGGAGAGRRSRGRCRDLQPAWAADARRRGQSGVTRSYT